MAEEVSPILQVCIRWRAEGQVTLTKFADGIQQIKRQIWAVLENGLME